MRVRDKARRSALVQLLLDKGADPTLTDNQGITPMHLAARSNDTEMLKLLRAKGGSPGAATTVRKETPVHFAAQRRAKDALKALLKMGQNIDVKDWQQRTALLRSIKHGHPETAKLLLELGADPNASTEWGDSPIVAAAERADADLMKALMAKGARMNQKLASGLLINTVGRPLGHTAERKMRLAFARFLIDTCKADVSVKNSKGFTPLHIAVRSQAHYMVRFLLDNGADRNAKDKDGLTPAHHTGTADMKRLLKTYGKK